MRMIVKTAVWQEQQFAFIAQGGLVYKGTPRAGWSFQDAACSAAFQSDSFSMQVRPFHGALACGASRENTHPSPLLGAVYSWQGLFLSCVPGVARRTPGLDHQRSAGAEPSRVSALGAVCARRSELRTARCALPSNSSSLLPTKSCSVCKLTKAGWLR